VETAKLLIGVRSRQARGAPISLKSADSKALKEIRASLACP